MSLNIYSLLFLLNFNENEYKEISELRKNNNKFPLTRISYDLISKKRNEMYMKGGFYFVSSTTLNFDLLNPNNLPAAIVTGIIINNIEKIGNYMEPEVWACTILKKENPKAIVIGIT